MHNPGRTRLPLALVATLLCLMASQATALPMRIAVLEFANASSDKGLQSLGKGLQSMLTTDLSKVRALSLIERGRLQAILAEQKLGASGHVDTKTAARIGKLAGASHLLAGTYTVHGAKMRLDGRLFAVEGGRVLLAEAITGEKDAFFELEKSLVRKLIKTLGVKLKPKERAGISRIHTADFAAFKRFSGGVAHFDAKRYEKALAAMRAAMKIDAEFKLARVTLGQYEQVIARIRAKADTLALSKRQLAALKADKVAHNDSLVAQRLIAIAREKGDAKQPRRLAALTYLVGFYNPKGRNHGRISRFQDRFDRFAIRSRAGTLARRYFVEAQTVFPAVPLFTRGRHPPDTVALIPKRIAGMTASLAKGLEYRVDNRLRGVARNLTMVQRFAHLIGADRRETIRLHELAAAKLAELRAEPRDQISVLDDLSKHYLAVGDVAAASGALTRKSALMTNPNQLKRVARELEELKALAQQLAQTDKKRIFVELIAHNKGRLSRNTLKQFVAGKPSKRLLRELARAREPRRWWSHRDPHWFWGSQPARLIQGEHQIITGPRTDGLRSNAIRYHRDASRMNRKDVLVAIGRVPLHNLDAAFELRRKPAKDFWPLYAPREATGLDDLKLDAGVPEVSFIIGLRDIDTRQERNPETRKRFYPRPTRGIAIRILPKGVLEIAQLGEKPPAEKNRLRVMTLKTLARKTGVRFSNGMKVRVRVRGAKVVVTVGRAKLAYTLPKAEATEGFLGLHFRGFGYTEVRNPKVKRK